MIIILAVLIAFIVPVLFVLRREWKLKKEEDAKHGGAVNRKKEPVAPKAVIKVTLALVFITLPVLYLSDLSYSFYSPRDSAVKVAFKHTGKRKADCGEADLFRKEGERYRKELRDSKQVRMSMEKLANCPRQRHPVVLELYMDGVALLDKPYPPTGLKKDMASYIYEEFVIQPGEHRFQARLYTNGAKDAPDHEIDETVKIGPAEVKVIRVDDKLDRFVIE